MGSQDERAARLDETSEALEQLLELLDQDEGLRGVLERLVHTARWAIPDADTVSVTVVADSSEHPRTDAATSDDVIAIDRAQYDAGDGPCLEAARTREPVRVSTEDTRRRWPEFTAAAEAAGVRAYLSAPLVLPDDNQGNGALVGALNVYSYTRHAFDPIDTALLRLLTTTATAAIGNARRYLHSRELIDQLRTALTSRAEIDQAKGALMAIHGITAEQAFARLVTQSQQENIKLVDLAGKLVDSLHRP